MMSTRRALQVLLMIPLALTVMTSHCCAQTTDTSQQEKCSPKAAAFIIPAVFMGYGLISLAGKTPVRSLDLTTKAEIQEDHPLFAAHADNYLQFSPAVAVFGLQLAGLKSKHTPGDAIGIYLTSIAIITGTVTSLKYVTKRERPDHSVFNSFPSGHTATVFASAEFLRQEYGDQYPWLGFTGYAVATATGALRMYNNRHWLSDVVAGAGFGILSTKLSYMLYPKVSKLLFGRKAGNFNLIPSCQNGQAGLCFNAHL